MKPLLMNQRRLRTGVADRVIQRREEMLGNDIHQVALIDAVVELYPPTMRRLRSDHL